MTRTDGAGSSSTSSGLRPGVILGQYQLIRELGRGGMGMVYLARDTRLGRRVAIKFLTHDDPSRAKRFLAEARVTARCKHDNIVDIYDLGEGPGCSYMVLEYLRGVTLRAWLRDRWRPRALTGSNPRGGEFPLAPTSLTTEAMPATPKEPASTPVSATLAVELMVPVVRALAYAHGLGLVHRDLKPENIMLTDDGSIKVLDFGVAKLSSPGARTIGPGAGERSGELWAERDFETRAGALVGTLPYMSPEQLGGGNVDARTDVWAVGITLWELCTGGHPLRPLSEERLLAMADVDVPMPSLVETHPQLGALAGVVDGCLRKRVAERTPSAQALLDELEPLLPGRVSPGAGAPDDTDTNCPDNPYVGLAAFQQADAARFFGRDCDISSLTAQLRNHRLVTVAGASGAGKSSLLRAGVIPALERSGQPWESLIIRPGRQPLSALAEIARGLSKAPGTQADGEPAPDDHAALIETLRDQPGYLGAVLRARCHHRRTRIVLFVDQFEELYTLGADAVTRAAFVDCLAGVADDASSPLRVLLSVRSDFLDRVAEDRAFTSEVIRGLTLLSPLSREQLRQALTAPLQAAGYSFESQALVDTMLDTLEATRSPLPLLQFTAARLWDARDAEKKRITQQSYDAMGGVEGALASHADAVLTGLSGAEQSLARVVFTSLVSEERTRTVGSLGEQRAQAAGPGDDAGDAMERVVRHLAMARLLLMETDNDNGVTVELTHESLIDRWPRLVQWLDENQEAAHFRRRLQTAAREWDRQGRTEDLLWRGQAARDAERWLGREAGALRDLGARDRGYLEAVVALDVRARRRRRRAVAGTIAVLSVVATVVAILAVHAERQAARADREARQARASAAQAQENAARAEKSAAGARNASRMASAREYQMDPTLALALVREMEPAGQTPKRWRELARWAMHQGVARVVFSHPDILYSAAFSPDGARVVTGSHDHVARVWNVNGSGEPVVLAGHLERVFSAAFSPDGGRIVTASFDKTARVWNADGTGEPIVLSGHLQRVRSAAFSPDGGRIVTASDDRTARVWNADGTGEPLVLTGHQDGVSSAAFSPDGGRIVTASVDRTARVWNADGTGEPIVLTGHQDRVWSAAFSPDGERIVTASFDETARVWDAEGAGEPLVLTGHQGLVWAAAFSPDGGRIVTASDDKTVRVWNADGSDQPVVFTGHRDSVLSAAFSPDGTRVVTASWDRTARLWSVHASRPIMLTGHLGRIYSAAFSPDSARVVTASWDRTARLWRADGTGQPMVLSGHENVVASAAFSPDGARVVTASWDRTARVWNTGGAGQPIVLSGHEDIVASAAFSPDGGRIVTASRDRTARVWNADGTGQPIVLGGHLDSVTSAAFSPDGARIVTASSDKTARVWRADGTGEPIVLTGHLDRVTSAAFSPDGARVVTVSTDRTARVWSAGGAGEPIVLSGHQDQVWSVAFSPDGARIITLSNDKTARVWSADGTGQPAILRIPELEAWSASFSPDGSRIVTASHGKRDPTTGKFEHWAVVWPSFEPFTGLDDPALWTATRYCPPVELRQELLGVSEDLAASQLERCRARTRQNDLPASSTK